MYISPNEVVWLLQLWHDDELSLEQDLPLINHATEDLPSDRPEVGPDPLIKADSEQAPGRRVTLEQKLFQITPFIHSLWATKQQQAVLLTPQALNGIGLFALAIFALSELFV